MTLRKEYVLILFVALTIAGMSLVKTVSANPSQVLVSKSAAATTTLSYITAGTATTTPAFDTQADGGLIADTATLAMQFTASSTATIFQWRYEYADNTIVNGQLVDCSATPTKCDWYSVAEVESFRITSTATTTPFQVASAPLELSWKFASTTQGAGAIVADNLALRIFKVPVFARYVRAAIFLQTGSTGGAVWTEWLGKKENR